MSTHTILAVDDEEFNLDILSEHLGDAGFNVLTAEDGKKALDILQQRQDISVIVLDRMMPNMNGMELLAHLKQDERLKDIPVIMQTAASSSQQIEEGIKAGVYYYLAKPYDESLLLSIVRSAISERESWLAIRDELAQQQRTLVLMEKGLFRFRTLQETHNLSYFIANCFPDPQHIVRGLNELMINAVEHGNLGITYKEKSELVMSGQWEAEIRRRLALPENKDKSATLEYKLFDSAYVVTISDQGDGFDWQSYLELSPERAMDPNGRGIAIAVSRSFDSIEYQGKGNQVVCRLEKK